MANIRKKSGIGAIILVVLLCVVFALFVVPILQDSSLAKSDTTQAEAARLIETYQTETGNAVSQEDVCQDLAYLGRQGFHPDRIVTTDGETIVYEYSTDTRDGSTVFTQVDTRKGVDGSYYYHLVEGEAEDTMRVYPWGALSIN